MKEYDVKLKKGHKKTQTTFKGINKSTQANEHITSKKEEEGEAAQPGLSTGALGASKNKKREMKKHAEKSQRKEESKSDTDKEKRSAEMEEEAVEEYVPHFLIDLTDDD